MLPDEPRGPTRRVGPQYEQKRRNVRPKTAVENSSSGAFKWLPSWLLRAKPAAPTPSGNALNSLRNGDRALIVAVNDSGNTGWVRFGRTGFENWAMM
jgi:tRNA-splicing endonuclease subunit Sen54